MPKSFHRIIALLLIPCLLGDPALASIASHLHSIPPATPIFQANEQVLFQQQALTARVVFQMGRLADRLVKSQIFLRLAVNRVQEGISVVRDFEEYFGPLHSNFPARHWDKSSRREQVQLWGAMFVMYSTVAFGLRWLTFHLPVNLTPEFTYAFAIAVFIVSYSSARRLDTLRKQGAWSAGLAVLAAPVLGFLLIGHVAGYNLITAIFGGPLAKLPTVLADDPASVQTGSSIHDRMGIETPEALAIRLQKSLETVKDESTLQEAIEVLPRLLKHPASAAVRSAIDQLAASVENTGTETTITAFLAQIAPLLDGDVSQQELAHGAIESFAYGVHYRSFSFGSKKPRLDDALLPVLIPLSKQLHLSTGRKAFYRVAIALSSSSQRNVVSALAAVAPLMVRYLDRDFLYAIDCIAKGVGHNGDSDDVLPLIDLIPALLEHSATYEDKTFNPLESVTWAVSKHQTQAAWLKFRPHVGLMLPCLQNLKVREAINSLSHALAGDSTGHIVDTPTLVSVLKFVPGLLPYISEKEVQDTIWSLAYASVRAKPVEIVWPSIAETLFELRNSMDLPYMQGAVGQFAVALKGARAGSKPLDALIACGQAFVNNVPPNASAETLQEINWGFIVGIVNAIGIQGNRAQLTQVAAWIPHLRPVENERETQEAIESLASGIGKAGDPSSLDVVIPFLPTLISKSSRYYSTEFPSHFEKIVNIIIKRGSRKQLERIRLAVVKYIESLGPTPAESDIVHAARVISITKKIFTPSDFSVLEGILWKLFPYVKYDPPKRRDDRVLHPKIFMADILEAMALSGNGKQIALLVSQLQEKVYAGSHETGTAWDAHIAGFALGTLSEYLPKGREQFESFIFNLIFGDRKPAWLATDLSILPIQWSEAAEAHLRDKMPTFSQILNSPERMAKFLFVLAVCRYLYPFQNYVDVQLAPVELARRRQMEIRLGEMRIVPATESFRRDILYVPGRDESIDYAVEIKVPGEMDGRELITENHFTVAEVLARHRPRSPKGPLPTFFAKLKGTYTMYGQQHDFTEDYRYLGIIGFDYEDRKRTRNVKDAYLEHISHLTGMSVEQVRRRWLIDNAIALLDLHDLGYSGAPNRKSHDTHNENSGLTVTGKGGAIGDYGAFVHLGNRLTLEQRQFETDAFLYLTDTQRFYKDPGNLHALLQEYLDIESDPRARARKTAVALHVLDYHGHRDNFLQMLNAFAENQQIPFAQLASLTPEEHAIWTLVQDAKELQAMSSQKNYAPSKRPVSIGLSFVGTYILGEWLTPIFDAHPLIKSAVLFVEGLGLTWGLFATLGLTSAPVFVVALLGIALLVFKPWVVHVRDNLRFIPRPNMFIRRTISAA